MVSRIFKTVLSAAIMTLFLIFLGVIISYFIDSTLSSLSTVLFIIGGVIIAFFSPGLFRNSSSGALHTPVVVYRLVNTLSRKGNRERGKADLTASYFSSFNLVLSGVLLWGVSYFV